ncbi:MAG TPA: DNRLRE domain-containing protein, partial [Myxococcaceae bacterium]|nr:DNRLRE domain-containing protein [Myxococcaceae bacterium]
MERHRWVKWLGLTVAVGCGGELATPAEVEDGDLGTARAKVIVQREVLAPTADTHAVAADPARNYGRADLLRVDGGPNGTVEAETYLRFQVPELQGVLTSAKLRLYATRASPRGAVALSSRGGGWSEYTLSWNTRLQAADQIASSTGPVAANSWVELDVTSIARGAFQGITTVIVRAAGEDSLFFASRNAADPSLRPQLLVTAEAAENLPTPLPLQPPMPVPADPPLSADACLSRREIFELSLGVNNNYFTDRTAPNTSFESRSILSVDADPRRE